MEEAQMTIWLWVIGITAIIWPVIITHIVEGHLHDRIEEINKWTQNKLAAEFWENSNQRKIKDLQEIIEHQDALITAVWQKSFGFYYGEDPYSGTKLSEYLGVKPQWHAHQSDWAGPVHYLVRYEPYPWGTHARHLNFPE
jgi:hypothetical protein